MIQDHSFTAFSNVGGERKRRRGWIERFVLGSAYLPLNREMAKSKKSHKKSKSDSESDISLSDVSDVSDVDVNEVSDVSDVSDVSGWI